jgi:hypothetical protein
MWRRAWEASIKPACLAEALAKAGISVLWTKMEKETFFLTQIFCLLTVRA